MKKTGIPLPGFRLSKDGRLVRNIKRLDASAQARARGKPAKNPKKWRVKAARATGLNQQ